MMPSNYVPVFKPGTRELLFRYDPTRCIIEVQDRKVKYVVDLTEYQAPESAEGGDDDIHEVHDRRHAGISRP
jgi:hypothetical protein